MPSTTIGPFFGTMPRITAERLESNYAQTASNCQIERGLLEAAKGPLATAINLAAGTNSIYWYNRTANSGNGYWFQFSNANADVMQGQIADDTYLRTYIFGDGAPKYTTVSIATAGGAPYPSAVRTLGLPAPDAPVAVGPAGALPDGATKISTAYVVTYVSDIGEEGPPSPASNIVDRWDGGQVDLSSIDVATGSFVIVVKRIYRVELSGVYQYVGSVSAATTTFADTFNTEFLGEPVPSTDWIAPSDDITGAISLPNGVIMAWWDSTLAFCEPYQPHAWPVGYRLALGHKIIGAAVTQNGVIVCTEGKPYLISGSTPSGMSQNPIDTTAAGLGKRSIVDMGDYAIYAGADGLIAAGGLNAEVVTSEFITPEQWRSTYAPASIIGCRYKDYYLGFYTGGSFLFKPGLGFLDFSATARALLVDDKTGDVYYLAPDDNLKKWAQGTAVSYTWKSRKIMVATNNRFAWAKVDSQAYPVTFKFYADGVLTKTETVASKESFRLPNNSKYTVAEFELTGTNATLSVQLTTDRSEIT